MAKKKEGLIQCQICGKQKRADVSVHGELVRPSIVSLIKEEHPDWKSSGYICFTDLNAYRAKYVKNILEEEKGEISKLDREVLNSLMEHELLARDTTEVYESQLTLGDRMADRIATFGGSWMFIGLFTAILIVWVIVNATAILAEPFDPYPFILLNLVLSTIAALQAPIIIMSQNRQEERDRLRAKEDYKINLKAELEIRHLSDKIDHILNKQWERMIDIQQIQMELMEDIAARSQDGKVPGQK